MAFDPYTQAPAFGHVGAGGVSTGEPPVDPYTGRRGDLEYRMTPKPVTQTAYKALPTKESEGEHWGVPTDPAAVRIRGAIKEAWDNTTGPITPAWQERMNNAPGPFGWVNRNIVNPAIRTAAAAPAAVGAGVGSTIAELTREVGAPELGRDINQMLSVVPAIFGAAAPFTPKALTPRLEAPGARFVPSGPTAPVNKEALAEVAKRQAEREGETAIPTPPGAPWKPEGPVSETQLTYKTPGVIPGTQVTTKLPPQGPLPPPPGYVPPTSATTISSDTFDVARAHYDLADHLGGKVGANANNTFLDKKIAEIGTQTPEARRFGGADNVDKTVADFNNALRDQDLSLRGTQEIDRKLGDRIGEALNAGRKEEAGRLIEMQHALRDHVENVGEAGTTGGPAGFAALKDARKAWSIAVRMQDIERMVQKAEGTLNPQQSMRTQINSYVNNPKMSRGWSKEDLDALRAAAKTGNGVEIMRTLSSRLVPIGAAVAGGPLLGTAMAVGETLLANQARDALSGVYRRRLEDVAARLGRNVPGVPGSEAGPPLPPGMLERMRLGRGPAAPPGVPLAGLLGTLVLEPDERRQ